MREIKFRGKRIDTGEWVHGAYIHNNGVPFIVSHDVADYSDEYFAPEFWWRIIPETVGQYTGLKDKNGKEIYEGDIVHCASRLDSANMMVVYEDGEFRMVLCGVYKTYEKGMGFYAVRNFVKEVIGNIYENPELLEVEK